MNILFSVCLKGVHSNILKIMILRRKVQTFLLQERFFTSRNLLKLSERHGMVSNFYPREKGHDIAAFLEKESRTIYAG